MKRTVSPPPPPEAAAKEEAKAAEAALPLAAESVKAFAATAIEVAPSVVGVKVAV